MTTETTCTVNGDGVTYLKKRWETNDKCMDADSKRNDSALLKEKREETKQIPSKDESKLGTDVTIDIPRVVEETEKKHINTYRIRFKHGDSGIRRENTNHHGENAEADNLVRNTELEANNKIRSAENMQEEEVIENEVFGTPRIVDEDTEENNSWSRNLPLLPEMQGNIRIKSAKTKVIRSLSTSKSSNWVLVGLNGKRHLRRPSPFPKETLPPISKTPSRIVALPLITSLPRMMNRSADRDDSGFSLPTIADNTLTKVNEWGFKTNPMTFSALLEVDHRKACLRDNQTVEFGKELGMLLKKQKEPQSEQSDESKERIENDAQLVENTTESYDTLEEHTPSALVVILTPVPPPTTPENSERPADEKDDKARRHNTCIRECGKKLRKKDDIDPSIKFKVIKKPPHETESRKPEKNSPANQSNIVCQSIKKSKQKKRSSLRKSRSTLPETLPDTSSFEKLPKLPDDVQYVFDDRPTKSEKQHDSKNIENPNQPNKSAIPQHIGGVSEQSEDIFNDKNDRNNVSVLTNDVSLRVDEKACMDLALTQRSDRVMLERLTDCMDFECKNDIPCTFEDDNTLQRAVVLRNRAFHPTSRPLTPRPDPDVSDCSYVFNKQSTHEWQRMDKVNKELDEYSEPSRASSFMDKLRPTLCDLERLLSKNFSVEHGEYPDSCKDIKQSKSVRFADLPPRRKREPSRSRSDPTNDTSKTVAQGSAEWNECFLVAVGENRTIKKEIGQLNRQPNYQHPYSDVDDEIGPELIEREMRRYTHWLRHDRAAEQHRWFSSSVSHRNFPISTHHVPSQQSSIYGISAQTSNPSISAKIAKTIGLYSVLPKPEIEVPSRPVRFPKVPVLPPIAGGSNELLFSRTFTGEVKGLPIGGRSSRNNRYSTTNKRRRGGLD